MFEDAQRCLRMPHRCRPRKNLGAYPIRRQPSRFGPWALAFNNRASFNDPGLSGMGFRRIHEEVKRGQEGQGLARGGQEVVRRKPGGSA